MELEILKIGGPLALALIVNLMIVREFLVVIKNHMRHDLEIHEKTIDVMNELKDAQKESTTVNNRLLDFLMKK